MARQATTTASFGGNVLQDIYLETFVKALRKKLVLYPLGKRSTLPEKSGKTVRWQFFSNPSAVTTTPTAEGDDPPDSNYTTTAVSAVLEEFAGQTPYTKFLVGTAQSGTKEEIIMGAGYQAALSVDTRSGLELDGGTTIVDAGASMTADALRSAVATLVKNNASPLPQSPGGQYFVFAGSAEACYDMIGEGAPTWVQAKSRDIEANLLQPLQDTPGSSGLYGALVKLSTNIPTDTTPTPDDDLNFLIGMDAFGVAELMSNPGSPSVIDTTPEMNVAAPARNRGVVAWWLLYVSKIIDNARYVVVKSDIA